MFKRCLPVIAGLFISLTSYAQPANDDCAGATPVTPDGTCIGGTTVLANDSWINLIGCQGGPGGPGGFHADVWYSFVATGPSFSTLATAGLGWTGDMEIILMEPGPLGCLDVFTTVASNCGPSPVTLSTTGLVIGNTYYIIVSNPQNGTTGAFTLCTTTSAAPIGCIDNEDCATAAPIVLNPSGNPGATSCIVDCNTGASPGIDFVGIICEDMLGPTVWYTFTTDALATTIDITLTSLDFGTPEFTLWANTCSPWTSIPGGCVEGTGGSASLSGLTVSPNTTYILAVSDVGGGQGNFDLCIGQNLDVSACNTNGIVLETSSSDPSTPVGGPYSAGEVVNYCYTIDPYLNAADNWMSAIVPTFGDCWDPSSFDVNGMPVTTTTLLTAGAQVGTWSWYPAGSIFYNNIVGSLPPFAPLPGGWYFVCTGCGPGNNGPTPNDSYGDGPSITGETWTVCFDLIAGISGNCASGETDCTVSFKTYADGEVGSWPSIGCVVDQPDVHPASYLCCPIFTAIADVVICDSFILPVIAGIDLTGNELYYDGPLGTGTSYAAGNTINFADYPGYPVVLYVYDVTSCGTEISFNLTIEQTPTVTFTALGDLCVDAGVQAGLGGGAPISGVYSGTGVTDDGNGLTYSFNPATAGVGIHTITYTVTTPAGCSSFATDNVEVFALPILTFAALADLCVDAGVQSGLGGGAPGGVGGVYSGPGVTDDGNGLTYSFDPAAAGVGIHIITYTYTDGNSCTNSITDNVEVFALPILTFTALANLCIDAGIQLGAGGATPAGGVYSGPGVFNDGNGLTYTFDPSIAGVGIHIITYTFTDGNSCTNSITDNVEVFALPILTFTALADLCVDAGVQLGEGGATPIGGVYSGTGVTDDGNGLTYSFDPAIAGVGTHIITYTFTDGNSCISSITDNVEVFALPVLTFNALADLCISDGVQVGQGGATPSGGVYSGPGVTDDGNGFTYSFDPAAAGAGIHIITYTYTDGNLCTNSITDNVEVLASPVFTITVTSNPTSCGGTEGFFTISGLSPSTGYSLSYTFNGTPVGPIAIVTDAAGNYTETGLGAGSYTLITVTIGGCSFVQGPFNLSNPGAPIINPLGPIVLCDGTYILPAITGTSLISPVYYDLPGGPLGGGSIIPVGTVITVTTTVYMYDENGSCSDQQTLSITINPLPTVTSVTGGGIYCAGATPADILVNVTGTANWTVDFTINGGGTISLSGSASPINLGNTPGIYVITGITDANCTNTAVGTQTITINPLPTVTNVTGGGVYCAGAIPTDILVDVTGAANWTVNYTLDGVPLSATGSTSPINLGNAPGVYVITNVTDANCTDVAIGTQTITINPLPTVTSVTGGAVYCAGTTPADILVNVTGSANWTVDYTLDGVPLSATGSSSPINLGNAPGVYVITNVTDANCTDAAVGTQTITIDPLPTVISVTGGGTYCAGTAPFDILVDVTGSPNWTVDYTLDGVPFSISGSTSPLTLGNAPGVYVITNITDGNCTDVASGTQTITINPLPAVTNISGGAAYCNGDPIGDILVDVTGSGNWTVIYTLDGVALTATGSSSPINLGNAPGIYVITNITDDNCTDLATGTQTIAIAITPTLDPIADVIACDQWFPSAITGIDLSGSEAYYNNSQAVGGTVLSGPITTSQTVYVYDDNGGCSDEISFNVTIGTTEDPSFSLSDHCEGVANNATITGATGGTFSFTIAVTDGATMDSSTGEITNGIGGTVYSVTYITSGSCPATSTETVTVFAIPLAPTLTGDGNYCQNNDMVDMTASGGAGIFSWFNNASLSPTIGTGASLQPLETLGTTTYYVTEEMNGCVGPHTTVVVTINVCDIIIPTAITPDNDLMNDDWEIVNLDDTYPNNVVYVYNRWGNTIFESAPGNYNSNRWNGTFKDNLLPVGSYYFMIEFNDGETEGVNGIVSIILE